MKLSLPPRRRYTQLSDPLCKRLDAYVLAATAAGIGLLASSRTAEAKIVYHRANVTITTGYQLDLNNDGKGDFFFSFYGSYHGGKSFLVRPLSKNLIWGTIGFASALKAGVSVGSNTMLRNDNKIMYGTAFHTSTTFWGFWQKVQNHFLGLKFFIHGKPHYGWARLNTREAARLTGYAYETVPNKPIITGRTKGPGEGGGGAIMSSRVTSDPSEAKPATLGRLAQGAVLVSRSGRTLR